MQADQVRSLLDGVTQKAALVSGGRVMAHYVHSESADVHEAQIPVSRPNLDDPKEVTLRRIIRDHIRQTLPKHNLEVRWGDVAPGATFTPSDGQPTRVYGRIVVTWWPRPPDEVYFGGKPSNDRGA